MERWAEESESNADLKLNSLYMDGESEMYDLYSFEDDWLTDCSVPAALNADSIKR